MKTTREDVLRYRIHAQRLDAARASKDCPVLDLGVQDTGPDGAAWALAIRRCTIEGDDLVHAWTLRGAPHVYRRADIAEVAAAVAPWSDADARKRTLDASKPLKAAGITMLEGMDEVATQLAATVTKPMVKGDVSGALNEKLPKPYLRRCNPCDTTHIYEQPFRLAALQAGLELDAGTSPPVLRPIPGWTGAASQVPKRLDTVRGTLHLLGPATPKLVADFLDASATDVKKRWPDDVEDVEVDGERRHILAGDRRALADPPDWDDVRLLGPFDLYLQARDRELILPDGSARKDIWRTIGRPGAVLRGTEIIGSWRPRTKGKKLALALTLWNGDEPDDAISEQAERLADFRGVEFAGWA